jgi:hypothetical protein
MDGMDDDDRLTLSGYDDDRRRPQGRRGSRGEPRWERLDARLDEVVHDVRYSPYETHAPHRPERRGRPILTLFLLALVAAGVTFVAAPVFTFRAVRSAAEFGDVQALSQLVDYNAVRQSLRTQIRPASAERAPPPDILRDPLGALRRAWEPVSPQADVDSYLTPEALALLSEGRAPRSGRPAPGAGPFGGPIPAVRFWSSDRVRLGVSDPAASTRETIFTLERRKLFTWRLVGVRLPDGAAPAPTVAR